MTGDLDPLALSASENDFLGVAIRAVVASEVGAADSTEGAATAALFAASCTYLLSAAKYPLNI